MALSPQWLDELKTRITLSALVQRDVKLQRAGREYRACCPFHDEKSPSFYVNDAKGFYHCFGCQKHGGAIDWLMEQRGLEFMDAVKELAIDAGMDMPAPDPRAAQKAKQRASLHDVMQAAQDWFVASLQGPNGAKARGYLKQRGIDPLTAERFGFGFAPDDRQGMAKSLLEANDQFTEHMLIEAGLLIQVDGKQPYARFRDRLMLPIQDARARVIAFGGRILDKRDGVAKYLNSPDTPLFDKGRTLYNMHRAAKSSRKTERVLVVEGYMDVIALAAAGIEDAVAPMGTALTENQIELLWRLADKPVVCFDGDAAGQRAAVKAISRVLPLLKPGHSLQVVSLPKGLDPDDLIKQQGVKAMEKLLSKPRNLLNTLWEYERDVKPLTSPEDKAGLKERLLSHVGEIGHGDIASLYKRDLMELYGDFAFPKREFNRGSFSGGQRSFGGGQKKNKRFDPNWIAPAERAPPRIAQNLRNAAGGDLGDKLARAVLVGLTRFPEEISRHSDSLFRLGERNSQMSHAIGDLLDFAETLEDGNNSPIFDTSNIPPPPDNTRFSFLVEGSDPVDAREDLAEGIALLVERPALEGAILAATARFDTDPEGAFAEQQRLRKRKLEIETRIGQMARKRAASAEIDTTLDDSAGADEASQDMD